MNNLLNALITQLNDSGRSFWNHSSALFVQVSILIVVLLLADLLLRKRLRATFRYFVWMLVFVKLVLPASLALPTGIGNFVGDLLAIDRYIEQIPTTNPEHVPLAGGIPIDLAPSLSHATVAPELAIDPVPAVIPVSPPDVEISTKSQILKTAEIQVPAIPRLQPLCWQAYIFIGWLVGVLVLLVLLLQRAWFVRGLIRQAKDADKGLEDLLEQCRQQADVKSPVRIRITENMTSPSVCGLFTPTILLPKYLLSGLDKESLRQILIHELAHVKRNDLWINLIQTLLQIAYFYNPFVWLTNAVVRRTREQAVDEMVLVILGGKAQSYSNTLIDIGQMAFWRPNLSLRLIGVVESKKALAGRIKQITTRPVPKSAKLGILGLLIVLTLGVVLLPMAKASQRDRIKEPGSVELVEDWSEPRRLGPEINTQYDENYPYLSADGTSLYFNSNRPGGFGGTDIYVARKLNGIWQEPENLGPVINSSHKEAGAMLSFDGRSLFFWSDRMAGDSTMLFVSKIIAGQFQSPEPLAYFINSALHTDEPFLTADNRMLYFQTYNRSGNINIRDLWCSQLEQGRFENPINLGPTINKFPRQKSPSLTTDGNLLYYIYELDDKTTGIVFSHKSQSIFTNPVEIYFPSLADFRKVKPTLREKRARRIGPSYNPRHRPEESDPGYPQGYIDSAKISWDGSQLFFSMKDTNYDIWKVNSSTTSSVAGRYSSISQDTSPGIESLESGLVGYWRFDEGIGSGATAYDVTGRNDGTIHGGQRVPGKYNGALRFDGVNDYVDVGNGDSLNIANNNITICMWVKREGWGRAMGWSALISKPYYTNSWGPPYDQFKLARHWNDDNLQWEFAKDAHSVASVRSKSNLPEGVWTHITVSYDGSKMKIYFNGALDASKSVSVNMQARPQTHVYIGRNWQGAHTIEAFSGLIDEVMIYNRTLSGHEIHKLYENPGLAGYWNFDNDDGGAVIDSSPYRNHGILSGRRIGSSEKPIAKHYFDPASESAGSCIYWTDPDKRAIYRAHLDGSDARRIIETDGVPFDIITDLINEKLYWTEPQAGLIKRADLEGRDVEVVVKGLKDPLCLAIDPYRRNIYWTDMASAKIQRADLDGSYVENLVTTGLRKPEGICLDIVGGKMYFTDIDNDRIYRANLDGTHVQSIVTNTVKYPRGIVIDNELEKIYWTDLFPSRIRRANLNGSYIENLIKSGPSDTTSYEWNPEDVPYGAYPPGSILRDPDILRLDPAAGKMYWTDLYKRKILRANLDGTGVMDIVVGHGPRGIALDTPGLRQKAKRLAREVPAVEYTRSIPRRSAAEYYDVSPGQRTEKRVQGVRGRAFYFDGIGDFINIEDSKSLDISGNQITISAWIKPERLDRRQVIAGKTGWGDNTWLVEINPIDCDNGQLNFYMQNAQGFDNNFCSDSSVRINKWQHVAFVYDGSEKKIYINGQFSGAQQWQGNINTNNQPLRIGAWGDPIGPGETRYFQGAIDEVAVYNRAMSAGQIDRLYHEPNRIDSHRPHLAGYWNFDGDVRNSLLDASTHGNHGVLEHKEQSYYEKHGWASPGPPGRY